MGTDVVTAQGPPDSDLRTRMTTRAPAGLFFDPDQTGRSNEGTSVLLPTAVTNVLHTDPSRPLYDELVKEVEDLDATTRAALINDYVEVKKSI